ncbi:hypothetical protein Sango_0655200 [Sesamum angolense]|uniref:Uncharacterized protein n=1 Tax=Sesamum angolense TaxID=2727404 RepID=A0AAE2C2B9_9LAMI|nr:hypothetical protein Sango_0655200 [Sesamum angolense]
MMAMVAITSGRRKASFGISHTGQHFLSDNLDVMYIEENVFDNIFNMVMDIKEKTKDNMNAHRNLKIIHNRPELELDERRPTVMPKAVHTLAKEQKRRVWE